MSSVNGVLEMVGNTHLEIGIGGSFECFDHWVPREWFVAFTAQQTEQ